MTFRISVLINFLILDIKWKKMREFTHYMREGGGREGGRKAGREQVRVHVT